MQDLKLHSLPEFIKKIPTWDAIFFKSLIVDAMLPLAYVEIMYCRGGTMISKVVQRV